jgi:hypothetical protein
MRGTRNLYPRPIFWIPESTTDLESGIQGAESGIQGVESGIQGVQYPSTNEKLE